MLVMERHGFHTHTLIHVSVHMDVGILHNTHTRQCWRGREARLEVRPDLLHACCAARAWKTSDDQKRHITERKSHAAKTGTEDASVVRSFVPLPEWRMDLRQRASTIKARPNCDAFLSMDLLIEPERLCSHIVLCLASAWNIARHDPSSI